MFFEPKVWNARQLADDLAAAGISTGSGLILHSSLRSLGRVSGGPGSVLEAVLDVLGPYGHLLVPTFTYSLPGWKADPFEYEKSPARTGAIPEFVRRDPRSQRSFHPTHSVAVIGPDAQSITANHMNFTPLGIGSPFSRMLDYNTNILMLGTRQDTNSSLHLCEVMAELPYINTCFTDGVDFEMAWYHNLHGEIEFAPMKEIPGCSRGFRAIEEEFTRRGVMRRVQVGSAQCQLLPMGAMVEAAIEILKKNPTLLLCHLEHCAICPRRRAVMEQNKALFRAAGNA